MKTGFPRYELGNYHTTIRRFTVRLTMGVELPTVYTYAARSDAASSHVSSPIAFHLVQRQKRGRLVPNGRRNTIGAYHCIIKSPLRRIRVVALELDPRPRWLTFRRHCQRKGIEESG